MPDIATKRVSLEVPLATHKAARQRLLDEETSFQRVLLPLLEAWAERRDHRPAPNAVAAPSGRNQELHAMVDAIMAHGDDATKTMLKRLLRISVDQLAAASPVMPAKAKKVG